MTQDEENGMSGRPNKYKVNEDGSIEIKEDNSIPVEEE